MIEKNNLKKIFVIILVLLFMGLVFWLRPKPLDKYREINEMGKEIITIDVCLDSATDSREAARLLDDVWQRLRDIYTRMSNFIDDSDIGKINRSYGNPQKVGADTVWLLKQAGHYQDLTKGLFDVTIRSLMELWWKCQKENRLPTAQELAAAKQTLGVSRVKIHSDNTVEMTHKNTRVDFGGIATGYALDEAAQILRKKGIKNFLIDAGGDMLASGHNCSRKPWTIAVRNPQDRSKIMDIVQVSNATVSTSGDYERFYSIQGNKYSHIINPLTGYPQKGVVSATVIAPTALDNDVLATTLCMLTAGDGISLIDSLGKGYAAIVITQDPDGQMQVFKSNRYQDYQFQAKKK